MATASKQVLLSIPELLGMTMAYLQFNDLLTATRVCRAWRHCLTSDPPARRILFLHAEPFTEKHRYHSVLKYDRDDGKLFVAEVNPLFFKRSMSDIAWDRLTKKKPIVKR